MNRLTLFRPSSRPAGHGITIGTPRFYDLSAALRFGSRRRAYGTLKGANTPIRHATASYSWMRPPKTSTRRSLTTCPGVVGTGSSPSGVARSSPRWGLPLL